LEFLTVDKYKIELNQKVSLENFLKNKALIEIFEDTEL